MSGRSAAMTSGGQSSRAVTPRALWIAVLAGPLAWVFDEGVALVIEARACAGPLRVVAPLVPVTLSIVAIMALVVVAGGVLSARRSLRTLDGGAVDARSAERMRFVIRAGILLAALGAYGIVLRLLTSLVNPGCA